jgi:hypothetical protein
MDIELLGIFVVAIAIEGKPYPLGYTFILHLKKLKQIQSIGSALVQLLILGNLLFLPLPNFLS